MKKRLLALALCLVMMTSLLPVAAYGENPNIGVHITGTGFEMRAGSGYVLKDNRLEVYLDGSINPLFSGDSLGLYHDSEGNNPMTDALVNGSTYYLKYQVKKADNVPDEVFFAFANSLNASNCSLVIPGYTASFFNNNWSKGDVAYMNIVFQVHKHAWQFKAAGNKLTGTCGSCKKEVSVSLVADSVTLPKSPFNARLEGWEQFKAAIPLNANPVFIYKCDGVAVTDQSNPKAGKYQAFVKISNLPGPVMYEGDKEGQYDEADLYVHYTAVDPAITAQTGDNRPIEIMVASVVVFSALAAAAFIVDSKRRSQQ